jgi:hypothetical protein
MERKSRTQEVLRNHSRKWGIDLDRILESERAAAVRLGGRYTQVDCGDSRRVPQRLAVVSLPR